MFVLAVARDAEPRAKNDAISSFEHTSGSVTPARLTPPPLPVSLICMGTGFVSSKSKTSSLKICLNWSIVINLKWEPRIKLKTQLAS